MSELLQFALTFHELVIDYRYLLGVILCVYIYIYILHNYIYIYIYIYAIKYSRGLIVFTSQYPWVIE